MALQYVMDFYFKLISIKTELHLSFIVARRCCVSQGVGEEDQTDARAGERDREIDTETVSARVRERFGDIETGKKRGTEKDRDREKQRKTERDRVTESERQSQWET